ncbi:MAG: carboxypeptidase regulatory-like domain-containing protein, partial [Myxococcaceae bacterium]
MNRTLAALSIAAVIFTACGGEDPYRDEVSDDVLGTYRAGLTMSGVGGCDTSVVQGLTDQLVEELDCIAPNAMVNFKGPQVNLYSSVQPFLAPAAASSLKATATAANDFITVSSAYRSLAQQYLLYKWYRAGQCNIQIAAVPGNSNHNGGRAVDIPYYSSWRSGLEAHGFTWYGSGDVVHFDYLSVPTIASKSILAFQKLWNKNHTTKIGEDSQWGPETESAMANAPVTGFSVHGCTTTGKLTGVIYQGGSTSNPVTGATVKVGSNTVTTAADGKYTFTLAPGTYTVTASKSGYTSTSASKTVTAGATTGGSLQINPVATTGVLKGTVHDSANAAISGATVTVGGQTKSTDASGAFSFTLQAGTYTVAVTKSGFSTFSATNKSVTAGGTTNVDVGLTATATDEAPMVQIASPDSALVSELARVTISGTAVDDNDAIANVTVQLNGDPAVQVPVTAGEFTVELKLR